MPLGIHEAATWEREREPLAERRGVSSGIHPGFPDAADVQLELGLLGSETDLGRWEPEEAKLGVGYEFEKYRNLTQVKRHETRLLSRSG